MSLLTEQDSEDKEDLPTVDLNDPVWSKEQPVPDSLEYSCIHEIPRCAKLPILDSVTIHILQTLLSSVLWTLLSNAHRNVIKY